MTYIRSRMRSLPPTILAVCARKLIIRGGQAFLVFVVAPTKEEKKDLQDILWCESILISSQQTILGYSHKGRWSLELSTGQALILFPRYHIGWRRQN